MVLKSSVLSLRKVKVGVKSNFVSTAKGAKTIVEEKMAHTFPLFLFRVFCYLFDVGSHLSETSFGHCWL